jgi:hypothetical protein
MSDQNAISWYSGWPPQDPEGSWVDPQLVGTAGDQRRSAAGRCELFFIYFIIIISIIYSSILYRWDCLFGGEIFGREELWRDGTQRDFETLNRHF